MSRNSQPGLVPGVLRVVVGALAAVVLGSAPAAAGPAAAGAAAGGWEPAPSAPWDVPAGARCDFPVHGEPVVDEVERLVLARHPDGSPKHVAYRGELVVRVVNADTGASYDADASGTAVVEHRADGSQSWTVFGPVLVGVGEGGGNLARGLYLVDGVFMLEISRTGYKTVTMVYGDRDDLCARID
ncbi:hypothetical protein QCN29_15605 [Streptomyces sp. HNM0663]|uniref:Uncharacterized protein n=1 Tax=Streptomyces chengmaiensis TaxID=3040919 RepID=A0ABT6HPD7_9ACTN|nr:hypothetical protein [Streptomyces chengmaiensis]MDH2390190.1 hypothetical protein [Streptomyces chengmaiensis]